MNPQDVINETVEQAFEWLEMADDPAMMLAGILASKIIKLNDHINYLEKRLKHDSARTN